MSDETIRDDGEAPSRMEPLIPEEMSKHRGELNDLAYDLSIKSNVLAASLPEGVKTPLADLVRSMNCYYSNLIEGHNTHPIDIERALRNEFYTDKAKRDLQLEAVAHIKVQEWIDQGGLAGDPLAPDNLLEIHCRFCAALPPELLVQLRPDGSAQRVTPGAFRRGYVQIGEHIPPSPGAVPRLLAHLHRMQAFQGRIGKIIWIATAHHRLVWVHPFDDLNGRVARMVSHAMLVQTVGSAGLWSAARGLGRAEAQYKSMLKAADSPRQGGSDGRGNLSEARLAEFARFFLRSSIDQVDFMSGLMQPDRLRARIVDWALRGEAQGLLHKNSHRILRALTHEGRIERRQLPELLNVSDRQARTVTSRLLEVKAIASDHTRAPLRLNFPAELAGEWMPGLFPAA